MRGRRWLLVIGCTAAMLLLTLPVVTATSGTVSPKVKVRMQEAERRLRAAESRAPQVPVRALVSFRASVRPDQALTWAEESGLRPTMLLHAFRTPRNTFRGGYWVAPDESPQVNARRYEERYRSMLEGYAASIQRMIDTPPIVEKGAPVPDERQVQQLRQKLQDLQDQMRTFEHSGIPVYGAELIGTPVQLLAFRQRRVGAVRLVEIMERGQPAVPLLPSDAEGGYAEGGEPPADYDTQLSAPIGPKLAVMGAGCSGVWRYARGKLPFSICSI